MSGWNVPTARTKRFARAQRRQGMEKGASRGRRLCSQEDDAVWRGALGAALLQEAFGDLEIGVHQALDRFLARAVLHVEGLLGNET